jgi:hypothetical protein
MYKIYLEEKLRTLPLPDLSLLTEQVDVQEEIDCYLDKINAFIHDSAKDAGCVSNKQYKPKPYWCPQLSFIRDKKRFWWSLWVENGRPRSGPVYDCWKDTKKLFRKVSRQCVNNSLAVSWCQYNDLYQHRHLNKFWNCIKKSRKNKNIKSNLIPSDMANYLEKQMQLTGELSKTQSTIAGKVKKWMEQTNVICKSDLFTPELVEKYIKSLNKGCSPGIDGVTAEHLQYGKSDALNSSLSAMYNNMLTYSCVPRVFSCGIIVPIIKNSSLNSNLSSNYRPITLSSVHTKIIEMQMLPQYEVCDNQFGFRPKRGTAFGCTLLNDIMCYFGNKSSPMYACSLDAEKCFDSIWHPALFYKLKDKIPHLYWRFLVTWYSKLQALVRWKGQYSRMFKVTRGIRQGSILSPQLFNICIDGLMKKLHSANNGVSIGNDNYTSFAYADDVTVFSATIPDLQLLIQMCADYAKK